MNCIPTLNVYALLTIDLLHEVELGVWKALFTHIIRILSVHSPESVSELDRRYRPALTPTARPLIPRATLWIQVPAHHFIWEGQDSPVFKQRIPDEEACGTSL